jgi:RNA polymerase sigma-70 factor, ECF subfamily
MDEAKFAVEAENCRRDLRFHCYRMTGSFRDAEDLVQETFLSAWKGLSNFESRSSFRTWLYQIATRKCLDALSKRRIIRRVLPELSAESSSGPPVGNPSDEPIWIEPFPDDALHGVADQSPGPIEALEIRDSIRLSLIAAIQSLPPRQRAALLLSEVLGWSVLETSNLLGGSTASINSAIQRARVTLAKDYPPGAASKIAVPEFHQKTLARYQEAWERSDLDAFVSLLAEEATYSMPPWREWYSGRSAIERFFKSVWARYGGFKLIPTRANQLPAFAVYTPDSTGTWHAHSLQLLELDETGIRSVLAYVRPLGPVLFEGFGLPMVNRAGFS